MSGEAVSVPSGPTLAWGGKGAAPRVVVALSGGVDSSVALALLARQGYDVVGVMAHFWAEPSCDGCAAPNKCCSPESEAVARQVCERVGAPFHVVDLAEAFRRAVVEPFIAEYLRGRTPNPCLYCNRDVKFGLLLDYALAQGARFLATGHYVRVQRVGDTFRLLRGLDARKDQSYVLYMLGQRELAHALFPLGELTKPQVRALAREFGLAAAERPESQEICFVRDNDYRRFLAAVAPDAIRPGPIYTSAGERVGTHKGLPYYTIGQREGLGIAHTEPLYVLEIRPQDNALVVGPARELGRDRLTASRVSFVAGHPPALPARITAKIRYAAKEVPATLARVEGDRAWVEFAAPLRDITPGQGVVFYDGEVVLGGGIIEA
jgi:tRNA-specific 2-thiouridylase